MNTTENNKLIAEFMGWKQCDPNDNTIYANPTNGALHSSDSDMRFHTSWDWLMPVVAKCLDIYHIEQKNDDLNFKFYDSMGDIEHTYKEVVGFIQEYRLTPKEVN